MKAAPNCLAHAGEAADHLGVWVLAKPGLDEGFDFRDLLVKGHHLLCQPQHHGGGQFLPGQGCVLGLGGLHRRLGEHCGPAHLAVAQPRLDAFGPLRRIAVGVW